ncbi:MAG: aminotransferase class V-fold PLP-dependent enzyme [Bacteroidetes bacterium]|nr:aminotransferase class V-fold PLP-dependent enzyme [Bacteroidota bacterium]
MRNQRNKFTLAKGITYLNGAYMSPLLKSVQKAGIDGIRKKGKPFGISSDDFFTEGELLRKQFAGLINQDDAKRVAIIPSASYGLSTAARNIMLEDGQKVIVAAEQFPSNVYPWLRRAAECNARVEIVKPPDTTILRGQKWNDEILASIDRKTRVVAIGHVHWADGTRFDLEAIRKRLDEVNGLLIIDGTQSVGALPFDMQKIRPDALICAGYKWLMGPYSIGLAYFGPHFDDGVPLEENWINRLNSEDFTALVKYEMNYQPGSLRYDVGEHSNFILVPMMIRALEQIRSWTPAAIQGYCKRISGPALDLLRAEGFWIEDEKWRGHHLFGIRLPEEYRLDDVKKAMIKNKISVSYRGSSVRVSPHVYNSEEDFARLVKAFRTVRPSR